MLLSQELFVALLLLSQQVLWWRAEKLIISRCAAGGIAMRIRWKTLTESVLLSDVDPNRGDCVASRVR